MNANRLDILARALATPGQRRTLLRFLSGGAIGGLLIRRVRLTAAKKKGKKTRVTLCHSGQTIKVKKTAKKKHLKHGDTLGACQPPPPPPLVCGTGGPCLVFVTSTQNPGNLGGVSGADIKCQLLANQAMLGGTYKAWISDIFNSPANRFAKSPGPYYLVNGDKVADSYADLTDGNLDKSINITELDTAVSIPFEVWTHTQTNGLGVVSGAHCSNWSDSAGGSNGDTGNSNLTDAGWTAGAPQPCAGPKRLYCFQQS